MARRYFEDEDDLGSYLAIPKPSEVRKYDPYLNYKFEQKESSVALELTPVRQLGITPLPVNHNHNKVYQYTTGRNEFTGKLGWKPITLEGFDPVDSTMVVHDVLEHFPGDEYEPHNEYQAQGAMFFLRHEGKFFPRATSDVVVEPAFGMLFFHIQSKNLTTQPCPFVKEAHDSLANTKTEVEILRTLSKAQTYIDSKFSIAFADPTKPTSAELEALEIARQRLSLSLAQAPGWMRIGYRRAEDRYKGVDKERLVKLFQDMVKTLDRLFTIASTTPKSSIEVSIDYNKYESSIVFKDSLSS